MKVMLDKGAHIPTRAHSDDAGYDLYSRNEAIIYARNSQVFDTGVHIEIPSGYVGFLKSKSGLNVNCDLLSEGVIDSGYTGSIKVKLYNHGDVPYKVSDGDKISQLVILPFFAEEVVEGDFIKETPRGSSGFGSSGK